MPLSPLGKGKGKISEIRYPSGSEYLRVAIHNAEAVGPSRVEPLYGEIFAAWYGLPFGVQVWFPTCDTPSRSNPIGGSEPDSGCSVFCNL